jgi:hypothetical protein
MTLSESVRGLLINGIGDAVCDACLAFACSASLIDVRRVTEVLLTSASFDRRERCGSCRRTVPAVTYQPKCAHCSNVIGHRADALVFADDMVHAACLRVLVSEEAIRESRDLTRQSRQLIESARRQIHQSRRPIPPTAALHP